MEEDKRGEGRWVNAQLGTALKLSSPVGAMTQISELFVKRLGTSPKHSQNRTMRMLM